MEAFKSDHVFRLVASLIDVSHSNFLLVTLCTRTAGQALQWRNTAVAKHCQTFTGDSQRNLPRVVVADSDSAPSQTSKKRACVADAISCKCAIVLAETERMRGKAGDLWLGSGWFLFAGSLQAVCRAATGDAIRKKKDVRCGL